MSCGCSSNVLRSNSHRASISSGTLTFLNSAIRVLRAVFVVVLFRHVVLRDFVRAHFAFIRIGSVFHTAHNSCLERLAFFQQFVRTLGIRAFDDGNSAKVPASRSCSRRARATLQRHRLDALAAEHEHTLPLPNGPPASCRLARRFARRFFLWGSLFAGRLRFNLFCPALRFLLLRFFRHVGNPPPPAQSITAGSLGHSLGGWRQTHFLSGFRALG